MEKLRSLEDICRLMRLDYEQYIKTTNFSWYRGRSYEEIPFKKIFVAGSAFDFSKTNDLAQLIYSTGKADEIGAELAKYDNSAIITGATPPDTSIPHQVVVSYKETGGKGPVMGIIGGYEDIDEVPFLDQLKEYYDILIHYDASGIPGADSFGNRLLYRDLPNVGMSDGIITIMGGAGTLDESSKAYHMGKPIGILSITCTTRL